MRIAFDHQIFCRQIAGGISRYYCRLAEELSLLSQQVGIFAPLFRNAYLKALPPHLVHGYGTKNYPPRTADVCVAVNALIAKPMIQRWKPDIVHETYFNRLGSRSSLSQSVITVFDMIAELNALKHSTQHVDFKKTEKYQAVKRADHVICISEHTRKDLMRLFEIPLNKVSVIHLGCDLPAAQRSELPLTLNYPKPFLLYVGLREGYKNFDGMLKAFSASSQLMGSFDIVAFGGGDFTVSERQLLMSLGFEAQQVRQVAGSDQELNSLYGLAVAFIYPSKYEGFGLPPLEAMAMKCPVVSSNTSSMPEVIGDAAEYFDPNDTDSIRSAMEKVVFSKARKAELIEKGDQRVSRFAWSTCAEKTLDVYRSLTHQN